MNINCTDKCDYQVDGKCKLNEVTSFVQSTYSENNDCPYLTTDE